MLVVVAVPGDVGRVSSTLWLDAIGTLPPCSAPCGTEVCGRVMGRGRSDFIISGEVYADKSWCMWDAALEARLLASGRDRAGFALLYLVLG